MMRMDGEQLERGSDVLRSEVRRAPVEVTYQGRPELVVLSVEDYALLRENRRLVLERDDMTAEKIGRIAHHRMDAEHANLDLLMND